MSENKPMKKVLIIGFLWPYHNRGGARVLGLAKYLPEFGWEPIVLTSPLDTKPETPLKFKIIDTPYKSAIDFWLRLFRLKSNASTTAREQGIQRLGARSESSIRRWLVNFAATRLLEILDYPDLEKKWQSAALEACAVLWQKEEISAIISSSPPVTSHLIAKELKRKYEIPWIADFPHLWSQNNSYTYSSLRRMFDRRLELKTLSQADALTTTSEPLVAKLRTLHKNKPIYSITHGFDPDTSNTRPDKLTDRFTITYTGSLGPVLREPTMLFAALQKLLSKGVMERDKVEVRFYGPAESWIDNEVEKYGLTGVVRQYGTVPMPVAHAKQRESQLLFNPKWDNPQEPGIHSMKILEYLAARRPILATGKYKDVVDDMLAAKAAKKELDIKAIGFLSSPANRKVMEKALIKAGADLIIENPKQLLQLID